MLNIVKYANRKLYNTATSEYITLNDILGYKKKKLKFRVTSRVDRRDLTAETLVKATYYSNLAVVRSL